MRGEGGNAKSVVLLAHDSVQRRAKASARGVYRLSEFIGPFIYGKGN